MSLFIPQQQQSRRQQPTTPENLAWESVYRNSHDPAAAAEVIEYLDTDPEARKSHVALYLVCRQTLRSHDARVVRTQRIAACLQFLLYGALVAPFAALTSVFKRGSDVAVEMMPQAPTSSRASRPEPAARRVKKLVKNSEFAEAKKGFGAQPAAAPAFDPAPAPGAVVVDGVGAEAFAAVGKAKAA